MGFTGIERDFTGENGMPLHLIWKVFKKLSKTEKVTEQGKST